MRTKTYVGEYSKELLIRLFKLNFTWQISSTQVVIESFTILFIDWDSKGISGTTDMTFYRSYYDDLELPIGELFRRIETLEVRQRGEKKEKQDFKPYDRILVRDSNEQDWIPALFRRYVEGDIYPYLCIAPSSGYRYAIPYQGNEHLVNKKE